MKTNNIKKIFGSIGLQLIFSMLSFAFIPYFSWLKDKLFIFSIFTAWLFIGALYSTFWNHGRKMAKNVVIHNNHVSDPSGKIKAKKSKGVFLALPLLLLNALFSFAAYYYITKVSANVFSPVFMIHRILISPFVGFLPAEYDISYLYASLIISVVIYLPCVLSYIAGVSDFSFIDRYFFKIVYKQKKKDDSNQ